MARLNPRLLLCLVLALCACDLSDLRSWVEGNRDIPAEWDFIPAAAREDLIDADIQEDEVSLRYHEGEWSSIVGAFGESLSEDGYTHVGSCPSSDGEAGAAISYAKLVGGGAADVVMVRLSMLMKSNGHFFIEVRRAELSMMITPEGCSLSEEAGKVCEDPSTGCRFKSEASG